MADDFKPSTNLSFDPMDPKFLTDGTTDTTKSTDSTDKPETTDDKKIDEVVDGNETDKEVDNEEVDDEEEQEEQKPKRRDNRVPEKRLKEVIEQRDEFKRQAELQAEEMRQIKETLAELKAQKQAVQQEQKSKLPEFDLEEKETALEEARIVGDVALAKKLAREIREYERLADREERLKEREEDQKRLLAQIRAEKADTELKQAATEIINKYPFLDFNSDKADKRLIKGIKISRFEYEEAGMDPAKALRKAVEEWKDYFPAGSKDDDSGIGGKKTDSKANAERAKKELESNTRAAERMPPSTTSMGNGDRYTGKDIKSLENMSVSDWSKLPDAERKRLMGM